MNAGTVECGRAMRSTFVALALVAVFATACAGRSTLSPGERKAAELESLLQEAENETRKLNIEQAKSLLEDARPMLRDPVLRDSPDNAVLWERFNQAQTEVEVAAVERTKRDLEIASTAQRQKLEKVVTRLIKAGDDLERRDVGEAQLEAVREAIEGVKEELAGGKAMVPKSQAYADDAKHARRVIERAAEPLALAGLRVAFRKGPVATLEEARAVSAEASKQADAAKKKELVAEAKAKFQACADEGRKQIAASAALATAPVLDQPKANSASAVIAACDSGVESAGKVAPAAKAGKPAKVPAKPKKPGKRKK